MTDTLIVTHLNPDVDAICSIWLLQRFDKELYRSASIAFVPSGEVISKSEIESYGLNRSDVTHVDTGGGEFDHHQDEAGSKTSASEKIYLHLIEKFPSLKNDQALKRVVSFANDTDHFMSYFWPEPTHDRYVFGIEMILNGFKQGGHGNDIELVSLGLDCLDGAYSMMNIIVEAEEEIKEKAIKFTSRWGACLAIESSNDSTMKLSQKMGNNIVVRKDPDLGNIRIKAAPLPEIDLTSLYESIIKVDKEGSWFFHPGKHMLLNGSRKNLGQRPSSLSLKEVIKIIEDIK